MKLPVFLIGLLTTVASAEEGDRERPRHGGGPGAFLRTADKDGDGAVSRGEFSSLERISRLPEEKRRQIFERLDKDGDGLIRKEELPKPPRDGGERGPFGLGQLDTNGDGSVDFDEFLKGPFAQRLPEERRRPFFDRLDRNGDGRLSPEDRPKGGGPRDGRRPEHPDPEALFSRLDQNNDGFLDFAEFRKAPWIERLGEDAQEDRFEKLDKNGDLKLDRGEMAGPKKDGPPGRRDDDDRRRGPGPRDGDRQPGGPRDADPAMDEPMDGA